MAASERGSQSVHRALSILQCFSIDKPAVSLTEIAERANLTMPTAHRMVKALQREDFLVQGSENGHYSLGPAVMRLARIILARDNHDELVVVAMPALEHLRSETGETVGLHVPVGRQRICVMELASRQPIRMATGIGHTYPLHAGAAGKALLAWQPEPVIEAYGQSDGLAMITDETITDPTGLIEELRTVHKQGYAVSYGETVQGASALAVPVFSHASTVAAAVNVTGPSDRWNDDRMRACLDDVLAVSREISLHLGHRIDVDRVDDSTHLTQG